MRRFNRWYGVWEVWDDSGLLKRFYEPWEAVEWARKNHNLMVEIKFALTLDQRGVS